MGDSRNNIETPARIGGIVLAGTYHWTGSSFEGLRVRPLLPVVLKPIIGHVLDWLDAAGLRETTICANGSTRALRRHLDASSYTSALSIGFHEDGTPRGAAGCVKDAASQSAADTFIVTDGTSIPTADVARLVAAHLESGAELTIVAHRRPSAVPEIPQFYPTGTYVFDRAVLDAIPATSFHDIKENLIPKMYRDGRHIEVFEVDDASPRVFSADTYLALNRWMIDRSIVRPAAEGRTDSTTGEVVAHPSAWIDDGAVIVGPVVLGEGVRVHASATIVGPSVIGAGTVIAEGATVARSITWDRCTVGEHAFVDQCVLSDRAAVGSGEAIRNLLRIEMPERRRGRLPVFPKKNPIATQNPLAKPAVS